MPPAKALKKKEYKPRPAAYAGTCVRCGKHFPKGTMVEPLAVPGEDWVRWACQGCSWIPPFNSLDSRGRPAVDGQAAADSTDTGIKNSEKPPSGKPGTPAEIRPTATGGQGGEDLAAQLAKEAADALDQMANDDYFGSDEEAEAEGVAQPTDKAGKQKPTKGKAGGGETAKSTAKEQGGGESPQGKGQAPPQIPKPTPELEDWVRRVVRDELSQTLPKVLQPVLDGIAKTVATTNGKIDQFIADANKRHQSFQAILDEQLKKLHETAASVQVVKHTYEVTKANGQKVLFDQEVVHEVFPTILDLATCSPRQHIFLPGPTGCGKTHLAQQVARAMELPFGYMSCSGGLNEAHLLGRSVPNVQTGEAVYVESEFLKRYEQGGVFLLDEIDAADPNVLIVLNAALANGVLAIPNRVKNPYANKHDDFLCLVAANTFGRGASRLYVGRNQIDEATLDRFRIGMVPMDYSPAIEKAICPNVELYDRLIRWRKRIDSSGMRRVLSTRFMGMAHTMTSQKKWHIDKIYKALTSGWTPDELAKVDPS